MRTRALVAAVLAVPFVAIAGTVAARLGGAAQASATTPAPAGGGHAVTYRAQGTFDVKLTPQGEADDADGSQLGQMALEKTYHGALEGSARGEMLTAMTGVEGSAGYVAVERVTGTLDGRAGSFVLLHRGVMTRGSQELSITVVPDSGSRALHSLAGRMTIRIEGGQHFYELEYELTEPTR